MAKSLLLVIGDYFTLPPTRHFNISLPHKGHSFSDLKFRHSNTNRPFNTISSLQHTSATSHLYVISAHIRHVLTPWRMEMMELSMWRICVEVTCRSDEFLLKWRINEAERIGSCVEVTCSSYALKWPVCGSDRYVKWCEMAKNEKKSSKKSFLNFHTIMKTLF